MARAKGINTHKYFKLGKATAKSDKRNLMFAAILKAPIKVPDEYDFDLTHQGIPTPMFGNDVHGDCVIAGRAHQTLRFEDIERDQLLVSLTPTSSKNILRRLAERTMAWSCLTR
jgi:hypothetical protein